MKRRQEQDWGYRKFTIDILFKWTLVCFSKYKTSLSEHNISVQPSDSKTQDKTDIFMAERRQLQHYTVLYYRDWANVLDAFEKHPTGRTDSEHTAGGHVQGRARRMTICPPAVVKSSQMLQAVLHEQESELEYYAGCACPPNTYQLHCTCVFGVWCYTDIQKHVQPLWALKREGSISKITTKSNMWGWQVSTTPPN